MPSKIEFEFQTAEYNGSEHIYIVEAVMRSTHEEDPDVAFTDTPFDADSLGCPGQRIVFNFNCRNKKLSGTYIAYYTVGSETINIYRINDKGEEYLIDPANYNITYDRYRGSYDDPVWAHLGYCDSESDDE
jgi:hypothetical protein